MIEWDCSMAVFCDFCGKKIVGLPFRCKRCNMTFCPKCRLPESHSCPGISYYISSVVPQVNDPHRKQSGKFKKISRKFIRFPKKRINTGTDTLLKLLMVLSFVSVFLYFNPQTSEITSKILTEIDNYRDLDAILSDNPLSIVTDNNSINKTEQDSSETVHVQQYMSSPKTVSFEYVLHGKRSSISYNVYGGMNDYLNEQPRSISYYSTPPTETDFIMRDLDNENQKQLLDPLVKEIQNITANKDDQARIAVSLVQNIDYDTNSFESGNIKGKYPYEVLYTGCGVCSEKSELLAYVLRELGFGVAIFRFDSSGDFPGHDAIGIKCPQQYSYGDTGYCFVESTTPSIITDSSGNYLISGNSDTTVKLPNTFKTLQVCDSNSFDSVSEEYNDNIEYQNLQNKLSSYHNNQVLSRPAYDEWKSYHDRWQTLVDKYGIKIADEK